jgi:hypothetical protein
MALTLVAALAAGSALATGEIIRVGNLIVRIDGGFKPKKLHKRKWTPIELRAEGHLRSDGADPHADLPIVDRLVIDFDRNGTLDTRGLPNCPIKKLRNTKTKRAKRVCKKALVAKGQTKGWIDFGSGTPFEAKGPLLAFNGKYRGKRAIIFHVFAHVPLPTTFLAPGIITNAPGKRWGKRVRIDIPPIAGGNGTLIDAVVRVKRRWRHKGKRRSYLVARCPSGRLSAKGWGWLRDRETGETTRVSGSVTRRCRGVR